MVKKGIIYLASLLILFGFLNAIAHSYYISESIQWSNNQDLMLKTSAGCDLGDYWSISAVYYSDYKFKPKGGQGILDFHHWLGWQSWLDYLILENETTLAIGGGQNQLFLWSENALGVTGGVSYTEIKNVFLAKGVNLRQWSPNLAMTLEVGMAWTISLDGSFYIYNFKLSREIIEQYQYLLQDREFINQIYADFVLYQLGCTLGYDAKDWGFYNVKIDSAQTYSTGFIWTGQLMWLKSLSKSFDLIINTQYSSSKNILFGTEIILKF